MSYIITYITSYTIGFEGTNPNTVLDNSFCDHCQADLETPLHAFWLYSGLDIMWSDQASLEFRRTHQFMGFKELLSWIIMLGFLL